MSSQTPDGPLVEPDWVESHLDAFRSDDPGYRILEVDEDPSVYGTAHVPGAVSIDWQDELSGERADEVIRREAFEDLMGRCGVTEETTLVVYGDRANWFAAHAYWLCRYYGHDDVSVLDGGRTYWLDNDYPATDEVPSFTRRSYEAGEPNEEIRADHEEVHDRLDDGTDVVDVRSPAEYRGETGVPAGLEGESPERTGHIPGAVNIPWGEAVRFDGRFKSQQELEEVYSDVLSDGETVSYCRIGERASHTWFVLNELLDDEALNYEGSFAEWSAVEDAPVEQGGD